VPEWCSVGAMRLPTVLALTSLLGLSLVGCGDVPSYWSGLGVNADGGKVMKNIGATDAFLVIYYERPASELARTCKEAFAPIVAKGWTTTVPVPDGDIGRRFDLGLTSGSDRIEITCMVMSGDKKELSVTFSHR
jgi:hypothetical protein